MVPLLANDSIKIQIEDTDETTNEEETGVANVEGAAIPIDVVKDPNHEVSTSANLNRQPLTNPAIGLGQRILGLSQKGDWDACEVTLKLLEKEAAEEKNTTPLDNITDEVMKHPRYDTHLSNFHCQE